MRPKGLSEKDIKLFTPQEIHLKNTNYFDKETTFKIGDISITPYWADHSAFDAYSFLVEANGKSLFYSGDFRSHGRKAKAFYWFTHNAPKNVDYLLLEGTTISRDNKPFKTEIENELVVVFKQKGKINLIYTSGQNIDRLTSIYRACKRAGKILVVDVYVAKVLKELSKYAGIPYPSEDFENLKVMFPFYTSRRLKNEGNEKVLYEFKKFKITKEEISAKRKEIVFLVRPSMKMDIDLIDLIEEIQVEEGQEANYSDRYIDNRVTRWRKIIGVLDTLSNLKRVCFTRKTFSDIPNMKKQLTTIQQHCENKEILFKALTTPARFYSEDKQSEWTNFLLNGSK